MWPHYIYLHRKASNGEPFYIGKGKLRRSMKGYERAHACDHRSAFWGRVVTKHGFIVEIIAHCITDTEAQRLERQLISEYGRKNIGRGPLVNLTDGGDGHAGIIVSAALRALRSKNSRGKRSEAWTASIRASRKNGGNGGVVKRGDKLPEKWMQSLSRSKLGDKNPYFGKPSPPSKKVKNLHTGAIYDSISRAAAAEDLSAKTLYQWLDGSRLNRSPLVRM